MIITRNILHPFLIGTYPLIHLFSENYSEINVPELILPLVIYITAPLALLILTNLILKNIIKSSLVVSIFLLLVLYFQDFYLLVIDFLYLSQINIAFVSIFLFIIFSILIIRTKKDLVVYSTFLNVIALSFYIVPMFKISMKTYSLYKSVLFNKSTIYSQNSINPKDKISVNRDIYYLIFDQYSRNDILKNNYNYDNSDFTKFLVGKGFYIADKSYSNYPHTKQSLASSLNMEYLNYLSEYEEESYKEGYRLYNLTKNNKVIKFLKSQNYRFIHFGAGSYNADITYTTYRITDAERTIIKILYLENIISPIVKKVFNKDLVEEKIAHGPRESRREGIQFQLDKLSEIPEDSSSTFVFMHLLIPHSPYVFDEDGNYVSLEEEKRYTIQQNYIRQLKFLNKKLMDVIEEILNNSNPKPIIIIQSDEGHYPKGYSYVEPNLSKYPVDKLRHKFAILNAFYFPDTDVEHLYPSITPVNTFRLVFNLYFGENFKLLEDRHYNTNYLYYYRFLDVTDKLKNINN